MNKSFTGSTRRTNRKKKRNTTRFTNSHMMDKTSDSFDHRRLQDKLIQKKRSLNKSCAYIAECDVHFEDDTGYPHYQGSKGDAMDS